MTNKRIIWENKVSCNMEKEIWGIILHMESVVGKDGLDGMTKKQLRELIVEVYQKLTDII